MSSPRLDIDTIDTLPFNASEWINAGHKYSDFQTNIEVLSERIRILRILEDYAKLLPLTSMSVNSLLVYKLPKLDKEELIGRDVTGFFTQDPSVETLPWLLSRTVPSLKFLKALENAIGQAWFDGAKSFIDGQFQLETRTTSLLFWVISWWHEVHTLYEVRKRWQNTVAWLKEKAALKGPSHKETQDNMKAILESFSWLEWNGTMQLSATISEIARLPSQEWVNDGIINMIIRSIQEDLSKNSALKNYQVVGVAFQYKLSQAAKCKASERSVTFQDFVLCQVEEKYIQEGCNILLFPIHVSNNHWMSCRVDLQTGTVSYGDSLSLYHPREVFGALNLWYKARFAHNCEMKGNILPCGKQVDSYSCGIGRQILALKREGNNVFPIVQATATTAHLMSFSAILSKPSKLLIQSCGKLSKSDSNLDSLMEEIEDSCPVTPEPVTEQTSTKVSKQTSLLSFFAPSSSKKQSHPKPTPPPSPQKKKAKVTAICMNSEDSKHIAGLSGISRSSVKARELNQKDQLRSLEIDPLKWKRFQVKILEVDPHAEFHPTARRQVQCSGCGEWTMGQTVYSAVRFLKHVKENCKHHGKAADKSLPEIQNPRVELPCPGLTAEVHTQIKTYLERSGAKGGGASSLKALSASLFSATWDSLNKLQRKSVETAYMHGLTWLNDHEAKCVYARDCKKIIKIVEGTPLQPCEQCTGLLENIIYNNKKYQNNELLNLSLEFKGLQVLLDYKDRHNLPLPLRFAKLAATGTFDDKEPFIGLLHAMTLTAEHAAKGISLQNMKYHPAFDDFCSVLALQSPAEYQIFRAQLGGRTQRSQHAKAALEPRFPIGITESTFDRALDYIQKVRYDGPLALSCDDTKLLPAYHMYYCKKKEKRFLLGTVGEPLAVADPDELQKFLENSAPQKATKLRLWCLQIPMLGIAPLILAAKTIPNDLDATDLLEYTWKILQGCWKLNLYIISYSCDGTEVERLVQRKIGEKADYTKHYTINHLGLGYDEITVNIYMFQGCPLTIIQDSNHCTQTFRNNLFMGAWLLTLDSYTASYDTIRRAAFMDGNPLYIQDV
ncbi:hypothetical protein M422DRAFT_250768 [Sphaerobolus stellatus SS14]|uniref:Ubiquitin-like protease family profile domain-containing protein n=1 Tax=Sphaerobolus stellatus (strain SS14) TaxID=990650 RepID=A0A0C9W1Q0_SPHS4|nr:hypothetical protein M422DRAFT_250768 [Sphaerobolus stellatus SS14]